MPTAATQTLAPTGGAATTPAKKPLRPMTIFAFGAFGGCCPTIAKLASFYTTNPAGGMPQLGTYIGLGLFAVLGAIIAVSFGAKELKAALVAGIAAPGLVTNIVAGSTAGATGATQGQQQALMHGMFVSVAYAQVAEDDFTVEPLPGYRGLRVLTLNPVFDGPVPTDGQVEFRFIDESGVALRGGGVILPDEQGLVVPVPDGAVAIAIGATTTPLPAGDDTLDITIRTAPSLGGDLLWALGAARSFTVQDIAVTANGS